MARDATTDPGEGKPAVDGGRREARSDPVDTLSAFDRALLLVLGWLLIVFGVAGLALPVLQGILFLVIGAAVLSLVSPTAFRLVRRVFSRWPKGWKRLLRWRRWTVDKITGAGGGNRLLHRTILVAIVVAVVVAPIVVLPLACGRDGDTGGGEARPAESAEAPAAGAADPEAAGD